MHIQRKRFDGPEGSITSTPFLQTAWRFLKLQRALFRYNFCDRSILTWLRTSFFGGVAHVVVHHV